jgi:hypothetical protein
VKKLSSAEVSSLLNRRNSQTKEAAQQPTGGMSLDAFYIGLAKAANKDLEDGLITSEMHQARRTELRRQYNSLKGR